MQERDSKGVRTKRGLGGTANWAVLGGNLPPSLALEAFCDPVTSNALGCRAGRPTERASGPFHPDQRHLLVRFRGSRRDLFREILSPSRGEGSLKLTPHRLALWSSFTFLA